MCLKNGDILATVKEGLYGICALLTLDEENKKLYVKNSSENLFTKNLGDKNLPSVCIENFDVSIPVVPKLFTNQSLASIYSSEYYKNLTLNKLSFQLLQILKWPKVSNI